MATTVTVTDCFRSKRKGKQPTDNGATPAQPSAPAQPEYDTVAGDYAGYAAPSDYMEIDEMAPTAASENKTEAAFPDVNRYAVEYEELNATPAEIATWREENENGKTGTYQDLVNGPVTTAEGACSKQYYNMPDIVKGKEPYSNVPLHSQ